VPGPKRHKPLSGPSRPLPPAVAPKVNQRRILVSSAAAVVAVGLIVGGIFFARSGNDSTSAAAAAATSQAPQASAGSPAPTADAAATPQIPAGQPSFAVPTATGQLSTDPACTGYVSATKTFGAAMQASGATQQTLTDALSVFIPSMLAAQATAKDATVKSALGVEASYFQAHGPEVVTAILAQNQTFLSTMPFLNADDYLETVCNPASS
jgi:hypothetical protein